MVENVSRLNSPTLRGHIDRFILGVFSNMPEITDEICVSGELAGVRITVTIESTTTTLTLDPNALTDCQSDTLELLRSVAPKRLTKPKLMKAFTEQKKFHGDTTIGLALTALAKRGLISRPRKGSRDGYGITDRAEPTGNHPEPTWAPSPLDCNCHAHGLDAPTDCERDILAYLTANGRTKQPDVVAALEVHHGESTIVKALARMVKDGRLQHVVKRGYAVAISTLSYVAPINQHDVPTECERDILEVITLAGRHLTQPMVIDALTRAGKLHGESTILKALTRMAQDGRLIHVKRRGFGLESNGKPVSNGNGVHKSTQSPEVIDLLAERAGRGVPLFSNH